MHFSPMSEHEHTAYPVDYQWANKPEELGCLVKRLDPLTADIECEYDNRAESTRGSEARQNI